MGAAQDKAYEAKNKAAGMAGNASGQGQGATDAAKQKASETAEYTKESAVAGKDKTGGVLQQATETVTGAVVGAKDAVVNTLGMGGDNTTKETSATQTIAKDHH